MKVLIVSECHFFKTALAFMLDKSQHVKTSTHEEFRLFHLSEVKAGKFDFVFIHVFTLSELFVAMRSDLGGVHLFYHPKLERIIKSVLWRDQVRLFSMQSPFNSLSYITKKESRNNLGAIDNLSKNEFLTLYLLSEQWGCYDIAKKTQISYKTVINNKISAMRKLGFENKIKFMSYLASL